MYYVNRLHRWPDGDYQVEIAKGRDSGDPGCLSPMFRGLGEGGEFENPRCAAHAAVQVRREWSKSKRGDMEIGFVTIGLIGELGVPGEEVDIVELFNWAKKEWDSLDKCDRCGGVLGEKLYGFEFDDEYTFCSDYCAEETWWAWELEREGEE